MFPVWAGILCPIYMFAAEIPMVVSSQLRRFIAYRPGRLAWGTVRVSAGLILRALLQAAVLILLARALGVERYGSFVATLAFMSLFVPLAGSGGAILLVRDTARDPALFRKLFGRGLLMLILAGPLVAMVAIVTAVMLLPHEISMTIIITLAVSELLFAPFVDLAARAYQGFDRTGRMTLHMASLFMVRLVILSIAWAIAPLSVTSAALIYAGSGFATALFTLLLAARDLGIPEFHIKGIMRSLRDGIHFGINYAAFRIHADIDKVMLARLDSLTTAGFFTAGYRAVQVVLFPILALLEAAYARFCRAGNEGHRANISLWWRSLPLPLVYTLLASIAIFLGADLVPLLLGADFKPAASVVRWLALLPLFSLLRYGLDVAVSTANRQRLSANVMLLGAAANICLNFWLIPLLSWKGAVIATYGAEMLMLIAFGVALTLMGRNGS